MISWSLLCATSCAPIPNIWQWQKNFKKIKKKQTERGYINIDPLLMLQLRIQDIPQTVSQAYLNIASLFFLHAASALFYGELGKVLAVLLFTLNGINLLHQCKFIMVRHIKRTHIWLSLILDVIIHRWMAVMAAANFSAHNRCIRKECTIQAGGEHNNSEGPTTMLNLHL